MTKAVIQIRQGRINQENERTRMKHSKFQTTNIIDYRCNNISPKLAHSLLLYFLVQKQEHWNANQFANHDWQQSNYRQRVQAELKYLNKQQWIHLLFWKSLVIRFITPVNSLKRSLLKRITNLEKVRSLLIRI